MARFRCCGNRNTDGHAEDCALRPPATTAEQKEPEPQTRAEVREKEEGCQFDIFQFEHIGECRGTCGDQAKLIRFESTGGDGKLVIVLIDPDDEAAMRQMAELAKRGIVRPISDEEMAEIADAWRRGDIEVRTMTFEEFHRDLEQVKRAAERSDPYLTIHETATILGFSRSWTRTLCRRGKFEGAIKLMHKWAIPQSAILIPD